MQATLYKLSKEDKMLVSIIRAEQKGDHWELWKETGQRDGQKIVHAPDIIKEGKAKRTLEQQVKLQFDSLVNKNKDKGYKETEEEAKNNKGTDASGVPKPMLALDPKKQDASFWTKNKWYVSRKLDGVRCLIGKIDGEVLAISRMGKDYSVSARFIIEDLVDTLAIMADGEFLDGELYVHEKSLQNISGLTRDQKPTDEHRMLQYHVYDVVAEGNVEFRIKGLSEYIRRSKRENNRIHMVVHHVVETHEEIKRLHDQFVQEGYEGAIARNAESEYLVGGRDKRMVKIKEFQDGEYVILGHKEGKRGLVDLVYVMDLGNGNTFDAKPMGVEGCELKTVPQKFVGKKANIRYFQLTDAGVPMFPILTSIRDYE